MLVRSTHGRHPLPPPPTLRALREPCWAVGLGHSCVDEQLRRCRDLLSYSTLPPKMRVWKKRWQGELRHNLLQRIRQKSWAHWNLLLLFRHVALQSAPSSIVRPGGVVAPWPRSLRSSVCLKTLFPPGSPPAVFMFFPSSRTLNPCLMEGPVRICLQKNAFFC